MSDTPYSTASLHAELLRNVSTLQNNPYDNCVTVKLNNELVSYFRGAGTNSFTQQLNQINASHNRPFGQTIDQLGAMRAFEGHRSF